MARVERGVGVWRVHVVGVVYLGGVGHLVALADAADASATTGAERGVGVRVGGPAAALLLQRDASVRRTLASLAEPPWRAQAHAARRHSLLAAHQRAVVVRLQYGCTRHDSFYETVGLVQTTMTTNQNRISLLTPKGDWAKSDPVSEIFFTIPN